MDDELKEWVAPSGPTTDLQQPVEQLLSALLAAPLPSTHLEPAVSDALGQVHASLTRDGERTARHAEASRQFFCSATRIKGGDFPLVSGLKVLRRLGVSTSLAQGNYGVNSVVYVAEYTNKSSSGRPVTRRCALKALIVAHGPFRRDQSAVLDDAVASELRQPPYSPYLLQYWQQFNAVVDGDAAIDWPDDVQTTPRGSLTKWLVMPLFVDGNLQSYLREHPVQSEAVTLDYLNQLMRGVAVLAEEGLLHRDIKLDNVLVRLPAAAKEDTRLHLVFADFGTMETMRNQFRGCLPHFSMFSATLSLSLRSSSIPKLFPLNHSSATYVIMDVKLNLVRAEFSCTPGNPLKVAPELRKLHEMDPAAAAAVDLSKAEVWALGALCFDFFAVRGPYQQEDSVELPEWCAEH